MKDKLKTGSNIALLFLFSIALIYALILIAMNFFTGVNNDIFQVTNENVGIYTDSKYLVIEDYSTFYSMQNIIQNIITSLHDNKINDVYNVLDENIKNEIASDKSKLTSYYTNNFKYDIESGMDIVGYQNRNNLLKLYKVDDANFICIVSSIDKDKITKIGIRILEDKKYVISFIEV